MATADGVDQSAVRCSSDKLLVHAFPTGYVLRGLERRVFCYDVHDGYAGGKRSLLHLLPVFQHIFQNPVFAGFCFPELRLQRGVLELEGSDTGVREVRNMVGLNEHGAGYLLGVAGGK